MDDLIEFKMCGLRKWESVLIYLWLDGGLQEVLLRFYRKSIRYLSSMSFADSPQLFLHNSTRNFFWAWQGGFYELLPVVHLGFLRTKPPKIFQEFPLILLNRFTLGYVQVVLRRFPYDFFKEFLLGFLQKFFIGFLQVFVCVPSIVSFKIPQEFSADITPPLQDLSSNYTRDCFRNFF